LKNRLIGDAHIQHLVKNTMTDGIMIRHAFNVEDTFQIEGRGLAVVVNKRYEELPSWLKLHVGDSLEIRSGDNVVRTTVKGIEMVSPWTPQTPFCILIPTDVNKTQVPIGSEVWVIEFSEQS